MGQRLWIIGYSVQFVRRGRVEETAALNQDGFQIFAEGRVFHPIQEFDVILVGGLRHRHKANCQALQHSLRFRPIGGG